MNDSYAYEFYATTKEAWSAMEVALKNATTSIYWEIFIFIDDTIGRRFLDILIQKARAGVEVKMIIDGIGSYWFSRSAENELRAAGAEVLRYNPLYPNLQFKNWLRRLFNRNHRKVLIVDTSVVFLGGVNVRDRYNEWDDLYIKIVGPVARPVLRGFAKSYISSGGAKKNVQKLLHPKILGLRQWRQQLQFIIHSPRYMSSSRIHRLYIRGLKMAQETVNLVTPYFVPSKEFLRAVAMAKKRGVKVNIFLPLRLDVRLAEVVARAYYGLTAKAGANLYFLPGMNHAKAISVDERYGAVGSINVSRRSARFDEEAGVAFTDTAMVKDLNVLFNAWKERSQPFDNALWKKRGWLKRAEEWIGRKLEDFV